MVMPFLRELVWAAGVIGSYDLEGQAMHDGFVELSALTIILLLMYLLVLAL